MAGFVQPVGVIGASYLDNDTKFEIYWNGIVEPHQLLSHGYQYVVLSLGIGSFAISTSTLLIQDFRRRRRRKNGNVRQGLWKDSLAGCGLFMRYIARCAYQVIGKRKQPADITTEGKAFDDSDDPADLDSKATKDSSPLDLVNIKSFAYIELLSNRVPVEERKLDLLISPLENHTERTSSEEKVSVTSAPRSDAQTSLSSTRSTLAQNSPGLDIPEHTEAPQRSNWILGACSLHGGLSRPETQLAIEARSTRTWRLMVENDFNGLVLRYGPDDSATDINYFLVATRKQRIPVVLMGEADHDIVDQIDFTYVSGVIVENACILPNGMRRDFFQANRVRDCISRVTRQRKHRPDFFLGFMEIWDARPSSAVLRRAFKLADFFGAVVQLQSSASMARTTHETSKTESSLSGFDWLKKMEIIELQRLWKHCTRFSPPSDPAVAPTPLATAQIVGVISAAHHLLALQPLPDLLLAMQQEEIVSHPALQYLPGAPPREDFFQMSSTGSSLCPMGCFNLREEVSRDDYELILSNQRHLKDLDMLAPYNTTQIATCCDTLGLLLESSLYKEDLETLINGLKSRTIKIYRGLDTGFRLPDSGGHFWSLSDSCEDETGQWTDIYISQKVPNDSAVIMHTFLAHQGVPRLKRYEEELRLAQKIAVDESIQLPVIIRSELEESTETELLFLLEQVSVSKTRHQLMDAMIESCSYLLLRESSRQAWVETHSRACLDEVFDVRTLLHARLEFFARLGCTKLPLLDNLVIFYDLLEEALKEALFKSDRPTLQALSTVLLSCYTSQHVVVEPTVDIYGLIFFCALRRLAFNDVYLETTDRCPFFLTQHDQAGVFAELWVLGSQCEIYFGVYPRTLGEIIYDRYRNYLRQYPPPAEAWNGKDVFTAYANVIPTVKVEGSAYIALTGSGSPTRLPGTAPGYRASEPGDTMSLKVRATKLGALSIFCFPAIVDVLLLTFVGRGFYLTAFMDDEARLMANFAILTALIMTSGVTGWVGSTGGFYLFSFAFDNLTHFLVQRLTAAFMLTSVVAFCGFFAFSQEYSWYAGFVYVIYLFVLTTFLNLLGIFATIHRLECPLPSGRIAMWKCMSILVISPVLSTFVNGHDLAIYLCVLWAFIIILLLTFRDLCHQWTSWPARVPTIKDKDLLEWYKNKMAKVEDYVAPTASSTLAANARADLQVEVRRYRPTRFYSKWWPLSASRAAEDGFVKKMAEGHELAIWLLKKEAGGEELPEMYSTTWFVQLELALNNQRQLLRGLKEHSPFITFRYAKYDLGQNVGLFLAALMDRWVAISMSARYPQIQLYYNIRARYAICFGLLYFLFGAVIVDTVLQRYWPYATKLSDKRLANLKDFGQVLATENRLRKQRYRSAIAELSTFLLLTFSITTFLTWIFVVDLRAFLSYFLSITGYSGVLIFQFNRCFTKSPRAHVLTVFVCCFFGFLIGILLRAISPTTRFFYDFGIALNSASIPAALVTFFFTGYLENPFRKARSLNDPEQEDVQSDRHTSVRALSQIATGGTPALSPRGSSDLAFDTNREILNCLTLDVDINICWNSLPEDVRRLFVDRVLDRPAQVTPAVAAWLQGHKGSLNHYNETLKTYLLKYACSVGLGECDSTIDAPRELTSAIDIKLPPAGISESMWNAIVRVIYSIILWTAVLSGGTPDASRELWLALRGSYIRVPALWILLKTWKVCWLMKNLATDVLLISTKKPMAQILSYARHGSSRTLQSNRISLDSPTIKMTGFIDRDVHHSLIVNVHDGLLDVTPKDVKPKAVAEYDSFHRLQRTQQYLNGEIATVTTYEHNTARPSRWPVSKTSIEAGKSTTSSYDKYGRVLRGEMTRRDAQFHFDYLYKKRPKGNGQVLRAVFRSLDTSLSLHVTVFWCVKPRGGSNNVENWISSSKVQRVIATVDDQTYDMNWTYTHPRDPDIETLVYDIHGTQEKRATPKQILQDTYGFLKQPSPVNVLFEYEDLLIHHPVSWLERSGRSTNTPKEARSMKWTHKIASYIPLGLSYWSKKVVYRRLPTSVLRTFLWNSWAKSKDIDAVSSCIIDEMILREEKLLESYWKLRDAGYLQEASFELDEHLEEIISAIEPSTEASEKCGLQIKSSDLFNMGLGKDANQLTMRLNDAYRDTPTRTSVIFSDNGCWPDNPGGVSNCRRDLINGHTTIRGHCLAESANDFGLPRYQIERNVSSLKILPLWGLDGKTPYHGLLDNLLQGQVDEKITATGDRAISEIFIPLLKSFIYGARSRRYTRDDLIKYSNVVLQMNRYFERYDFNKTWNSELTWQAWIEAWLITYDNDPNVSSAEDYFDIERPSMSDFREAMNLYICYFFIYSVEVPADCPAVYQSTHHGISSLYGMILKFRRGTNFGIWDHAILWRETCLNISPAQCLLSIPVQAMLLAGVKLACHCAYTHVDVILPCTSLFNTDWERDLGTDQGNRGSTKLFTRKIDPIVNGIGNMDAFQPVKEIRSKFPTTIMLSNVQFIKDVKNAVLAADVIINKYGFDKYRLTVYGAQDRQPSYALETTTLITTRNLTGKVILGGFGSPKEVLKDAWLFQNSSLSEGLPLAIGEAALSGVPIVATEVGATALVLTDPYDPDKRYGEVVPPNDPEALARAQISLLAMLGPWAQYTTDETPPDPLPDTFTPDDVERITQRMYDKTKDRQKLGLKLREVVLHSFHGDRYLREHEQMYWVQRKLAEIRRQRRKENTPFKNTMTGETMVYTYDVGCEVGSRPRWQEFELQEMSR